MEKEIMPLGSNLMIQPYEENPYLELVTEGGLQLTNGEFQNPDSGMIEKLKSDILCGRVIEVGPKCTDVIVGDEVLYDVRMIRPVPFMGKGFVLTHEQGLIAIINEGLSERFKK